MKDTHRTIVDIIVSVRKKERKELELKRIILRITAHAQSPEGLYEV